MGSGRESNFKRLKVAWSALEEIGGTESGTHDTAERHRKGAYRNALLLVGKMSLAIARIHSVSFSRVIRRT